MSRPDWIGKTLGARYQIQEILGQGGMSAVYKAMDPNLKRVVAIKLIHAHLSEDPKFISRFEEEAQAVAQLRHPNITQIYDFNHDGDIYYMVQEFLAGETLQERLRRLNRSGRRMPLTDAVRYTIDICSAIGYAHERSMIHRDIKPANIMIDLQERAILMDFGIVKIVGGSRHTATGAVVGTAMYMSPDVIRGEAPDARSDIYSLGATLFEMISGRPPFQSDTAMSLMMMHLNDPPPDVRQLRPETPSDLIAILEKSLAKKREDRFSSAGEMGTALKTALIRMGGKVSMPIAQAVQPSARPAKDQIATLMDQRAPAADPFTTQIDSSATPVDPSATLIEAPPVGQNRDSTTIHRTVIEEPSAPGATPASTVHVGYPAPQGEAKAAERRAGFDASVPPSGVSSGAMRGSSMPAGRTATPERPPPAQQKTVKPALIAGGGAALILAVLCLLAGGIGGFLVMNRSAIFARATDTLTLTASATPTTAAAATALIIAATETPTLASPPTETPTPQFIPTATVPPGAPFVRINVIEIDGQRRYVVFYEIFEFTESITGEHVHFFFNTTPSDQAGKPGAGPWIMYGGSSPFSEFKTGDRPENASQLCVLVANPDHSVQPNSGGCYPLPDVPTVTMRNDTVCRAGPGERYDPVSPLPARAVVLIRGLSADEGWWYVQNPENLDDSCWIPVSAAVVGGDISQLRVVEAPPLPTPLSSGHYQVEITGITLDDQNRYVVEFITQNFTAQIPGIHIHFFFDTVPPEQVGMGSSGNRLMHSGPSPFRGFAVSDRPPQATQICALVANSDHSVILESGNCFKLPDTP